MILSRIRFVLQFVFLEVTIFLEKVSYWIWKYYKWLHSSKRKWLLQIEKRKFIQTNAKIIGKILDILERIRNYGNEYIKKLRHYEKATKFEKISYLFWQNCCFYSRVRNKHIGTLIIFEVFSRGYILIKGGYVYWFLIFQILFKNF